MKNFLLISMLCAGSLASAQTASKVKLYMPFDDNTTVVYPASGVTVAASTTAPSNTKPIDGNPQGFGVTTPNVLAYSDGKFGKAGHFTVSPLVSTGLTLESNKDYTLCVWIKYSKHSSALPNGQTLVHQKDVTTPAAATGRIYLEQLKGNATLVANSFHTNVGNFATNFSTSGITPIVGVTVGEWYHIAVVQTGTNRKCYVNGLETASAEITHDAANAGQIVIGASKSENASYLYDAHVDELLITQEALSAEKIAFIKDNGVEAAIKATSIKSKKTNSNFFASYNNSLLTVKGNKGGVVVYDILGSVVFQSTESSEVYNVTLNNGIYVVKNTEGEVAKFMVK